MDQFVQLAASIAVMWLVLTAVVLMVSRRHAAAMNLWLVRTVFHGVRATIGGTIVGLGRFFVWLGNEIRH